VLRAIDAAAPLAPKQLTVMEESPSNISKDLVLSSVPQSIFQPHFDLAVAAHRPTAEHPNPSSVTCDYANVSSTPSEVRSSAHKDNIVDLTLE
jgi:hypothetical protein